MRDVVPAVAVAKARLIGLGKGTFEVESAFFEPLPDDVVTAFSHPA